MIFNSTYIRDGKAVDTSTAFERFKFCGKPLSEWKKRSLVPVGFKREADGTFCVKLRCGEQSYTFYEVAFTAALNLDLVDMRAFKRYICGRNCTVMYKGLPLEGKIKLYVLPSKLAVAGGVDRAVADYVLLHAEGMPVCLQGVAKLGILGASERAVMDDIVRNYFSIATESISSNVRLPYIMLIDMYNNFVGRAKMDAMSEDNTEQKGIKAYEILPDTKLNLQIVNGCAKLPFVIENVYLPNSAFSDYLNTLPDGLRQSIFNRYAEIAGIM